MAAEGEKGEARGSATRFEPTLYEIRRSLNLRGKTLEGFCPEGGDRDLEGRHEVDGSVEGFDS
jgi:hypothetical protein